MNEYKTIKELAAEIGVSEQALRQWCKKNNVRKERTQGTKPSYIIDFDTEKAIKKYYSGETSERKAESKEAKERTKKASSFDNDILLETLTKQLEVKDKQIEALTEQNSSLIAALQAAQALHGMDKQQTVIEVKEDPGPESQPASSEPQEPPRELQQPHKRTLSERIRAFFK